MVFQATKAGALYAIVVFSIGFILGTIRVLLLAPRLGETTAVIIEAPIMLAASWFICRWCVDRLDVRRTVPVRSLMSLVGFAVLMSAGRTWCRARSITGPNSLQDTGSMPDAIGLAAQIVFVTFPLVEV